MSRWRFWIGGVGLSLIGIIVLVLPQDRPGWGLAPIGLVICWGTLYLGGELAGLVHLLGARPEPLSRINDDKSPTQDVLQTRPNLHDSRYHRFEALATDAGRKEASVRSRSLSGIPRLRGKVQIFNLFVSFPRSRWIDPEIAQALASVQRAARWINAEGTRWNVPVEVVLGSPYFVGEDAATEDVAIEVVAEPFQPGLFAARAEETIMASASRVASMLGFEGLGGLIDRVEEHSAAHVNVWLLHPRAQGRSHAIPGGDSLLPGASIAACYAREAGFPGPMVGPPLADSATMAHELLHLFGATDKYGVRLRRFPARSVTGRDIMRLDQRSLESYRIDPLTAAEIGWSEGRASDSPH